MGLVDNVNLLVASLDLKLVQLVRGAMRAADAAGGRGCSAHPLGPAPTPVGRLVHRPQSRIDPRPVIHPTPRFEPRPVLHPRPAEAPPAAPPASPEVPRITRSPLEPPWKVLPWEAPPALPPKTKIIVKPPDLPNKGRLFDVFI